MAGKKTYIVGGATILFAVLGALTGNLSGDVALQLLMTGLGMMTLRHAISTSTE